MAAVIAVIKQVITDKRVIGALVGVVLYLNFVAYVQHYHKKPPKVRVASKPAPAPAAQGAKEGGDASSESKSAPESESAPAAAGAKK